MVIGAMQTPDGSWRVEAVREHGQQWYRLRRGDEVWDRLSIAAVERILRDAGVDRATLVPLG